jgi:hypothetical protein
MGHSTRRVIAATAAMTLGLWCADRRSTTHDRVPPVIDLTRELDRAGRTPASLDARVDLVALAGDVRPAIRAMAPHRLAFVIRIPMRAVLTASVGLPDPGERRPVLILVGISDDRFYEKLLERRVEPAEHAAWQSLAVDLSLYAGWQWSLFYRPSSHPWRIIFSAYPLNSGPPIEVAWAEPHIRGR